MPTWYRLINTADCPPGATQEVVVQETIVAVFNVEGSFYALEGICPHQGGPLGKGQLNGCIVTCPWHGWQFDVTSGQQQINHRIVHATYPTRMEGEDLWVQLPDD